MNDYYIFLNSNDQGINRNNTIFNFTCNLPRIIDITNENWEIGLSEIHFFTENNTLSKLYVCCDLIKPSFTPNESLQILRFIPSLKYKHRHMIFDNINYFDIIKNYIDKIRIYIISDSSISTSLEEDTLNCTLHLRKKTQ